MTRLMILIRGVFSDGQGDVYIVRIHAVSERGLGIGCQEIESRFL